MRFRGKSKAWRPDGRTRRHGVPMCRQERGKRIREMAVECGERGAPACSGDVVMQTGRTGRFPVRRID